MNPAEPSPDCAHCPRLHDFIAGWREREPGWHNAPVPTWCDLDGPHDIRLLIVGLAPGLRGANRSGRPFTGDFSGELLHATLKKHGLAEVDLEARANDSLRLKRTAITNAVRCVPPENKPTASEINTCRTFLQATIARFKRLQAIVTLGKIAHDSTVRALGGRVAAHRFGHGAISEIDGLKLFSSYHCSRYNTNTGVLTPEMFDSIFNNVASYVEASN
ncbi:uracil-DNA glycosylase [Oricola sp.]|uniref:uracil-DNA glycosylase n=1 Tax=Oricola sp. TaxID=1979950 RepID=UPI003BAA148F